MTADYNGWNDAPEAEREAMDVYSRQEFEQEALAQLEVLQKFAFELTGSRDGAEDLVFETMRRGLDRWEQYQPDNVRAWLCTILYRLFLRQTRRVLARQAPLQTTKLRNCIREMGYGDLRPAA